MQSGGEFQSYEFPKRVVADVGMPCRYRIYKDDVNYILVEADTAMDAVNKSGLDTPYRIEKHTVMTEKLLGADMLKLEGSELEHTEQDTMEPGMVSAEAPDVVSEGDQPASESDKDDAAVEGGDAAVAGETLE